MQPLVRPVVSWSCLWSASVLEKRQQGMRLWQMYSAVMTNVLEESGFDSESCDLIFQIM